MAGKVGRAVQTAPSANIVRTWQGGLEIILRLAVLLTACGVIVVSSLALTKLDDITDLVRLAIAATGRDPDPLIKNSTVAAALGITVGGVVVLMEVFGIVQRFCNIRIISRTLKFFLSLDVILSFFWAVGFCASGILAADMAREWAAVNDRLQSFVGVVEDVFTMVAATAGTALFAGVLTSFLVLFLICLLIKM